MKCVVQGRVQFESAIHMVQINPYSRRKEQEINYFIVQYLNDFLTKEKKMIIKSNPKLIKLT